MGVNDLVISAMSVDDLRSSFMDIDVLKGSFIRFDELKISIVGVGDLGTSMKGAVDLDGQTVDVPDLELCLRGGGLCRWVQALDAFPLGSASVAGKCTCGRCINQGIGFRGLGLNDSPFTGSKMLTQMVETRG